MDLSGLLNDLLFDYTLRTVALGAMVLGVVSGSLGSFAVLRKQSLLGDAMSHAALPGIVLAFILTRSKLSIVLLLGAIAAGWVATLMMTSIVRYSRIKQDSALGLALSVFFGFGLMLLTFVQRIPDATQAGLNSYLFGQAAALLERDVISMAVLGGAALLLMAFFWKEFKLLSFDPDFGASLGFPMRLVDILLTTTLVIAIVVGLQAVGVVLMSAMIVAPAAAARQWTDRLGLMVLLAALFGAAAGVIGTLISSSGAGIATGPTIVLTISVIVLLSLLFASNRGLVWQWVRRQQNRRRLRVEAVLANLYTLAVQHEDRTHAHDIAVLRAMDAGRGGVEHTLQQLQERGLVAEQSPGHWALTPAGLDEAQRLVEALEA
jgi:manganese/zinc/iron transport system permease protein